MLRSVPISAEFVFYFVGLENMEFYNKNIICHLSQFKGACPHAKKEGKIQKL